MDAVKFIEERNRMCESFGAGCIGCPAYNESRCVVSSASTLDATDQIAIVEHIVNPTGTTPASVVVFSLRLARLTITLLNAFLKRFPVQVFSHCQPAFLGPILG